MAKGKLQPPRGTRDFFPEDLRLRQWFFEHCRAVAHQFAFEEVDAPIVEHAELFTRKAGEEIVEQLYHFEIHGRHLALRPELTPSIARMVMSRAGALRFPLRWFAIGQNWRYERMTRGRKREHYQWNAEIIGAAEVSAEAELMAAIFSVFGRLGLPPGSVKLRVNSRALLEETLLAGILRKRPEIFAPLCVIVDKLSKIGTDAVAQLLSDPAGPVGIAASDARDVVDLLSVQDLEAAVKNAPADSPSARDLGRLFALLDAYEISEHVVFDASVVRGLAYYTGVVFEAFDAAGTLRAVCGGGRYDRLFETLGGKSMPAVGFGFGDVVIQELLADHGLLPELSRPLDAIVFAMEDALRPEAIRWARQLRGTGQAVEIVLDPARLKRVYADADRAGARRVYLIGPDELERGVARVRDLQTGDERDEKLPD